MRHVEQGYFKHYFSVRGVRQKPATSLVLTWKQDPVTLKILSGSVFPRVPERNRVSQTSQVEYGLN